jgi:hypothetical protein
MMPLGQILLAARKEKDNWSKKSSWFKRDDTYIQWSVLLLFAVDHCRGKCRIWLTVVLFPKSTLPTIL